MIFAIATDLIVTRNLDLNSRILNGGRKKKKHKEIWGSNDQSGREKEDQVYALIPNDGNQGQLIENLN